VSEGALGRVFFCMWHRDVPPFPLALFSGAPLGRASRIQNPRMDVWHDHDAKVNFTPADALNILYSKSRMDFEYDQKNAKLNFAFFSG